MWTPAFWKDAAERAIKTGVQSLIATFGVGTTVLEMDWGAALAVSGTATLLSVLTSIVSEPVGDREQASLVENTGKHHLGE